MHSHPFLLLISTLSLTLATSFTPTSVSVTTRSTHYWPTPPLTKTFSPEEGAAVTATVLYVESTFRSAWSYKELESEIFLAAPTDAQLSLAVNGYSWDAIVTQTWYETGVDSRWRDMINVQEKALQNAMDSIAGGAKRTIGGGLGVGMMAVLAAVGGLCVLLL